MFALAHATGKTGRFTLIERWRNNERLLAPNESPLKILNKLGEYSSEVQFILQKSEKPTPNGNATKAEIKLGEQLESNEKTVDGRKSSSSMEKSSENIGIVKGIPQKLPLEQAPLVDHKVEASKEKKSNFSHFQADNSNLSSDNLLDLDLYNQRLNSSSFSNTSPSPVTSIGVSGSLKPPAYRNPPPATKATPPSQKLMDGSNGNFSPIFSPNEFLVQNVQYRDLVQLIKYQRDKINTQQNDLTKVSCDCHDERP